MPELKKQAKRLKIDKSKSKKGGVISGRALMFRDSIGHRGREVSYDGGKTWSSLS